MNFVIRLRQLTDSLKIDFRNLNLPSQPVLASSSVERLQDSVFKPFTDSISCKGSLPSYIPPTFPQIASLSQICAAITGHPRTILCRCISLELTEEVACGSSNRRSIEATIDHCFEGCTLEKKTERRKDIKVVDLD